MSNARTGVEDGILQSDLDANHFKIVNLDSSNLGFSQFSDDVDANGFQILNLDTENLGSIGQSSTQTGVRKSVYLSARTDGIAGTGTLQNPYDASTRVKLDTLWANLIALSPSQIVFLPGLYLTNGSLLPISNCTISGSSRGATIRADIGTGVNDSPRWIFRSDSATAVNNSVIKDFILDCNLQNQTAINSSIGAIYIYGSKNRRLNNKIINFGTNSVGVECFVNSVVASNIVQAKDNESAYNEYTLISTNVFAVSIVSDHSEDGLITDAVNPDASWNYTSKIHDETFYDLTDSPGHSINCINMGSWSVGQKIYDNKFRNIATGSNTCIYQDTGASFDADIRDNIGENVSVGINLTPVLGTGHICSNAVLDGNKFALAPGNPSYGIVTDNGPFPGITVSNNQVTRYGSSSSAQIGILIRYAQNGKFFNNKVGSNIDANYFGHYTNLTVENNRLEVCTDEANGTNLIKRFNRTSAGAAISGLADSQDVGSFVVSSNTAVSIDSEVVLFSGTDGKTIKRATTTGLLKAAAGVLSEAVARTDYWDGTVFGSSGAFHAKGLVPDPGNISGNTKFLREDATWQAISGSAGGTVTSVNVTTNDGVSGVVNTATSTPDIVLSLGATTPNSVSIDGTAGAGFLDFRYQSSDPALPSTGSNGRIFFGPTGVLNIVGGPASSYKAGISVSNLTAHRSQSLQDKSGTFAYLDDVSASVTGLRKSAGAGTTDVAAVEGTDYWGITTMGAAGGGHAKGLVPDSPASATGQKFLKEDATWATTYGTTVTISALDVDWSSSDTFKKTLAANSTFTFSNTANKSVVVALTNTINNYTVTWPVVKWVGGSAPVQTVGAKTDVYTFVKIGSDIYGSVVQNF